MASSRSCGRSIVLLIFLLTISSKVEGAAYTSSQVSYVSSSGRADVTQTVTSSGSTGGNSVTSSTVNGFTQLTFTTPDGLTCSTTAPVGVWACTQNGSPVRTVPVTSLPLGICSPTTSTTAGGTTTVVGSTGQVYSFTAPEGLTCTSNASGGWNCARDGIPVTTIPVSSLPQGGVCTIQPTASPPTGFTSIEAGVAPGAATSSGAIVSVEGPGGVTISMGGR